MKLKRKESDKAKFSFPAPIYYIAKLAQVLPSFADTLHSLETSKYGKRLDTIQVDRPIYVTGVARAGTTITLEMLSHHPEVGNHMYLHMVMPYIPHWIQQVADKTPLMLSPTERIHQDRMMVNRTSPEAVEEIFWQKYFENVLDESKSNIMGEEVRNPRFEMFYRDHIRKLLADQRASRYAAKNNYNVTRMKYLQKIFPDVKFIIVVRNPFDHIASLIKQDVIFSEVEREDPRLLDWTKVIGHREFGTGKVCINVGDTNLVKEIREHWSNKRLYVKGWAKYWASLYAHVYKTLEQDQKLAKSVLIVRYETLCEKPAATIDRIFEHAELDVTKFKQKQEYVESLRPPSYYSVQYTDEERNSIIEFAGPVAKHFDYDLT